MPRSERAKRDREAILTALIDAMGPLSTNELGEACPPFHKVQPCPHASPDVCRRVGERGWWSAPRREGLEASCDGRTYRHWLIRYGNDIAPHLYEWWRLGLVIKVVKDGTKSVFWRWRGPTDLTEVEALCAARRTTTRLEE